jgi:hypothetical protein
MAVKKIDYGPVFIHPEIPTLLALREKVPPLVIPKGAHPVWQHTITMHEGTVLYYKLWNFFVRAGVSADLRANLFFRDYESANVNTDAMLGEIGFPWRKAETEEEIWDRIGMTWNWLRARVLDDGAAYATISSVDGSWPSILDYAAYYGAHGGLVWAACFSKAHLFATMLGRMVYPRFRFGIASTHHTEDGAPPTATHVYVAAYVADRWFYLDPTAAPSTDWPAFANRRSIGVPSFTTVDYTHPYDLIPVPLSGFVNVPALPA